MPAKTAPPATTRTEGRLTRAPPWSVSSPTKQKGVREALEEKNEKEETEERREPGKRERKKEKEKNLMREEREI